MWIALQKISSRQIIYLSIGTILFISVWYFLIWPITSLGSTDMWYHLNGGRYFFENDKIPRTGFFSFIAQSRDWIDYYWLFQVLLYKVFALGGYNGLVIFRAFVYLATVIIISCFLLKNESSEKRLIYLLILVSLFTYGLIQRHFVALRPHSFSYLFIPLFLYLIEYKSRFLIALPLLAIVWSNLHGIEFPVVFIISGAYLIEFLIDRRKDNKFRREMIFFAFPLVLTIWAVLINPAGFSLLQEPLNIPKNQFQYILELKPIRIDDFFIIKLYPLGEWVSTTFKILIIAACFGCIKSVLLRNIRTSHLLLFVGGMFLLTQAERFRYEAILLSLPILKFNLLNSPVISLSKISRKTIIIISILITLASFVFFKEVFGLRGKYPFSYTQFPQGIVKFLNHIRVGGRILNSPNYGGYLEWALNPNYKIFMDLQMSLFTDEDYFMANNALNQKEALACFIGLYNPDFIIQRISNIGFRKIITNFPEYKPVFCDHTSVLYMNGRVHPHLAAEYEIRAFDPYTIMQESVYFLNEERVDILLKEFQKMNVIFPECALFNLQIARLYERKGELAKATGNIQKLIHNYPELPTGYVLKGDLLVERKMFAKAILAYENAAKRSQNRELPKLHKKMAFVYSKMGRTKTAYKYLKNSIDIFSPSTSYLDLYHLGILGIRSGKTNEGVMILKFALIKTPRDRSDLRKDISRILSLSHSEN